MSALRMADEEMAERVDALAKAVNDRYGGLRVEFNTGGSLSVLDVCEMLSERLRLGLTPVSALDAVRGMILPGGVLVAAQVKPSGFTRKSIFNALTYLARTGELARIGHGKYQAPPSGPGASA